MKFYRLFLIITLPLLLVSCFKRNAIGKDDTIIVLADKDTYDIHKPALEKIFDDPIFAPMIEKRYYLKRVSFEEFDKKNQYKNIILLTDVDSDSEESKFINQSFSDEIKQMVRDGKAFYYYKQDQWAKKQNVVFLMDSKNFHLDGFLENYSKKIFDFFNDRYEKISSDRLFGNRDNIKGRKRLNEKFSWDAIIPHDYYFVNEGKETRFARFRRFGPDRWLTIIEGDYDNDLDFQENVIKLRDKAGSEFGDSVKVNTERIIFEQDTTFTQNGIKVKGIWEYQLGGGPFITYGFVKNNRLFLIDGAVFAPSKDKYPYIKQLELIIRTVNIDFKKEDE